jgi:hypothetical protein
VEGCAALIELSEFDWSEAKLSCYGRNCCAGIGVITRYEHGLPLSRHGRIRSELSRRQMIEGFYEGALKVDTPYACGLPQAAPLPCQPLYTKP